MASETKSASTGASTFFETSGAGAVGLTTNCEVFTAFRRSIWSRGNYGENQRYNKQTYQILSIFNSCNNVNLAFFVGEFRDIDGFRTHRPAIWLNLLGNRFLFDRRGDFVEGKVGGCACEKLLLGLQGFIALSFAKLLQAILDNDLMMGLEF